MTNNDLQQLLTVRQVASYLNIAVGTLRNWRHLKRHDLRCTKVGGRLRYYREDVERFARIETIMESIKNRKPKKLPVADCYPIHQYDMVEEAWYDVTYDKNGKMIERTKLEKEND
jgi:excisionase family DNA binding protein